MKNTIKLDKERKIKFTLGSAMELETILDEPFLKTMNGFVNDPSGVSVKKIITLLWAGLIHEDKDLTIGELVKIYDESKNQVPFNDLITKLTFPISVFFQGGKEKNVKKLVPKIPKKK